MLQLQSFLGLFVFLAIAYGFSNNRNRVTWQFVATGMGLQFTIALILLGVPSLGLESPFQKYFFVFNDFILGLLKFSTEGASFIFGDLAKIATVTSTPRLDKTGWEALPIVIRDFSIILRDCE